MAYFELVLPLECLPYPHKNDFLTFVTEKRKPAVPCLKLSVGIFIWTISEVRTSVKYSIDVSCLHFTNIHLSFRLRSLNPCEYYGHSVNAVFPRFFNRFPWCFRMFPQVFLRFPRMFLLFPLGVSPVSYFRFCMSTEHLNLNGNWKQMVQMKKMRLWGGLLSFC